MCRHVLVGVDAAAAEGASACMLAPSQEDGFAVEQDAGAVDADVAEADVVSDCSSPDESAPCTASGASGRPEEQASRA